MGKRALVIPSPQAPIVLGLPWLRLHNPHIDWSSGMIRGWSPFCHSRCLRSALSPSHPLTTTFPPELPGLTLVPPMYHDLGEVFSKHKAQALPPHRPYDCAKELLPEASLPSSRLYNLSRPEREAMESYIHKSLAVGLIRHSSSPVGAGFFFVKKKEHSSSLY